MTDFNIPQAIVATFEHNDHPLRRRVVAQFFSAANICRLDYMLKDTVKKYLACLQEYEESGEPVHILDVLKALTSDFLTAYAVGRATVIWVSMISISLVGVCSKTRYATMRFWIISNCSYQLR